MLRALPPTAAPTARNAWQAGLAALTAPAGAASAQFARAAEERLKISNAWPTASGRAALFLLLQAMKQQRPDRQEVLLPAYTCPALVAVIERAELRPRLVDVTLPELTLDPTMLATRLRDDTLALIHVHPFGLPRPIEALRQQVHSVGAWLIEDAAQAMGARVDGERVGRLGDGALFSLGPGKALSTGGGGLLAVQDETLVEPVQRLYDEWRVPSRRSSALALARLAALEGAFRPVGWRAMTTLRLNQLGDSEALRGFAAARLTDAQAALGTMGLTHLDRMNAARHERAEQILEAISHCPTIRPVPAEHGQPIYLRLPVLVEPPWRERLLKRLHEASIGAGRMYPKPLHHLFPHLNDGPFPGAEAVAHQLLTFPTHAYVRPADITRIADTVRATTREWANL